MSPTLTHESLASNDLTPDTKGARTVKAGIMIASIGCAVGITAGLAYASRSTPDDGYMTPAFKTVLARGAHDPFIAPATLPDRHPATVPFLVSGSVITDTGPSGRGWYSQYTADSLPPAAGNIEGYGIYQVPAGAPEPSCSPSESITRSVNEHTLVICLGPQPTEAARTYWTNVEMTDRLTDITWLNAKH